MLPPLLAVAIMGLTTSSFVLDTSAMSMAASSTSSSLHISYRLVPGLVSFPASVQASLIHICATSLPLPDACIASPAIVFTGTSTDPSITNARFLWGFPRLAGAVVLDGGV